MQRLGPGARGVQCVDARRPACFPRVKSGEDARHDPRLGPQHRFCRRPRSRRSRRQRADHGAQGPRLYRPHVRRRVHRGRCRRPAETADQAIRRRPAEYPRVSPADPWRPAADGELAKHLGDAGLFRSQRLFQGLDHRLLHQARQNLRRRACVFDVSRPADPREIAFMPIDGLGLVPALVCRRALCLCASCRTA